MRALDHHGDDALGNSGIPDVTSKPVENEHAVSAINRLPKDHWGDVTLLCLGPLTNIALALRLNPLLPSQMKDVVIMGGNYRGVGNMTLTAEFNFFCDTPPEWSWKVCVFACIS